MGGRIAPSSRFSGDILWTPIPRQKLVDALGRMIWQPGKDVGEPGLRIDTVELRGRDEPMSYFQTSMIAGLVLT